MSLTERLAEAVDALPRGRVLVAFDGPDAAGKTTLARAVAQRVTRPALQASVDGWHNPRQMRHRRGETSPVGYYLDAFDVAALVRDLLLPFRHGAAVVPTARHDHRSDTAVEVTERVAPDTALLFDGVFLQRPGLRGLWDLTVYLHVGEDVTLSRAVVRGRAAFEDEGALRRRYEQRYLPGQALYREAASPVEAADVVVDNSDVSRPVVLRWQDDSSTAVPPPASLSDP